MNVTNTDFEAIENALYLLKEKEAGRKEKRIIKNAFSVLEKLQEKKQKDNERTKNYIAEKRVNDKNYARSRRKEK